MIGLIIDLFRLLFGSPFSLLGFIILGRRNTTRLIKNLASKLKEEK